MLLFWRWKTRLRNVLAGVALGLSSRSNAIAGRGVAEHLVHAENLPGTQSV